MNNIEIAAHAWRKAHIAYGRALGDADGSGKRALKVLELESKYQAAIVDLLDALAVSAPTPGEEQG